MQVHSNTKIFSSIHSWGFCDETFKIPNEGDFTDHKYFEVETTLLPNSDCGIDDKGKVTSKQCTGENLGKWLWLRLKLQLWLQLKVQLQLKERLRLKLQLKVLIRLQL